MKARKVIKGRGWKGLAAYEPFLPSVLFPFWALRGLYGPFLCLPRLNLPFQGTIIKE